MRKIFTVTTQILFIFVLLVAAQEKPKPLTNSDVTDMVKAGLPESTILLTIERSPANFDTSFQTLIQLNKAGVPAKILDAMVKANSPAPAAPAGTQVTSQVSAGAFQEIASSSSLSGGAAFIDGGKRTAMKRMTPKTKTSSGKLLIPYAGIFMKAKSYAVFNGNHSDLRTGNTSPEVEVALDSDIKASDAVGIVRLEIDKDSRKTQMLEFGVLGGSSGSRKKDIVPVSIKETSAGNPASRMTVYRISVVTPLSPGEYAVVVNGSLFYDFGIDIMH